MSARISILLTADTNLGRLSRASLIAEALFKLQLLQRLTGRLDRNDLAVGAAVAVLANDVHGRDQALVIDVARKSAATHHLKERWRNVRLGAHCVKNEPDDELKRRSGGAAALGRSHRHKRLSRRASLIERDQLPKRLYKLKVHGYPLCLRVRVRMNVIIIVTALDGMLRNKRGSAADGGRSTIQPDSVHNHKEGPFSTSKTPGEKDSLCDCVRYCC